MQGAFGVASTEPSRCEGLGTPEPTLNIYIDEASGENALPTLYIGGHRF